MSKEELDPRYLSRLVNGEILPALFINANPGSRLRKFPRINIYFKWIDFELWRRIAKQLKERIGK